jgi:DNA-directed RNA polymerase specialized sigma24 family protein
MANGPGNGGGSGAFDEASVLLLLAAGELGVGRALVCIEEHLRGHTCLWLGRRFPGLRPEDVADAWADTLLGVCQAARQGRFNLLRGAGAGAGGLGGVCQAARQGRFNPGRPLLPWLRRIAQARATDQTRRRATRQNLLTALRLTSRPATREDAVPAEAAAAEVRTLVHTFLPSLPGQQKVVLEVFIGNYPETASLAVLRREVSRVTGADETPAAVRRALQEGRRKLRLFLAARGYSPLAG